ncbi:hypothetical protein B0T26DRAFT_679768 [Lasiosphaeria miniovina]|uniref:Uncharacterized protein n=1 Tax=Lasiosphaeria miniovina TaxID=1954250 RepID=A0AA39ZYK5_9PEZI|nr:uncharacterized protein B0T26DRAFT_679768 [Lasiosphaeria miniovina]KAK0706033.1 hypothetical protein B0T26DRAFT_679768 [Lasiosphaeria miniovina]
MATFWPRTPASASLARALWLQQIMTHLSLSMNKIDMDTYKGGLARSTWGNRVGTFHQNTPFYLDKANCRGAKPASRSRPEDMAIPFVQCPGAAGDKPASTVTIVGRNRGWVGRSRRWPRQMGRRDWSSAGLGEGLVHRTKLKPN